MTALFINEAAQPDSEEDEERNLKIIDFQSPLPSFKLRSMNKTFIQIQQMSLKFGLHNLTSALEDSVAQASK
jgi:hypothetical protein